MSFILPYVSLGEVKPAGVILPQAPADIPVFLFCSSKGTNFVPNGLGSQQQVLAETIYGAGPVREGGYIAAVAPVSTVWVKVPATAVLGMASSILSSISGTAAPGAIGGTILDGFDVVVVITTAGTIGTSYAYKVSLDGGNTFGTPIAVTTSLSMAITGTLNGVSIATGITVALTSAQTFILNDTFAFFTLPPSQSILTKTITRVNASTATAVPSGTPNDWYNVVVTFGSTTGTTGTIGVVGLTYSLSLDGGLTNTVTGAAVPLSGVIVLPDHTDSSGYTHQTGLTLTVGAGTLDPLDTVSWATTGPVPAWADVATAMDAVRGWNGAWSFFYLCGWGPVATRNSAETKLQAYAASGRFTWASVQGRDLIAGERVAASPGNVLGDLAWGNRIAGTGLDGWGASVGNRTPPSFGATIVTDPVTGRRQRRPFAVKEVSQLLAYTPDTNPGEYDNGPLSADTRITNASGVNVEHDARINPTVYAMGGNVVRTWEGEQGIDPGLWPADGHLMSSAGDITDITQRRVLNLADAALVVAMRQQVLQKFGVAPATAKAPLVPGNVFPWEINRMTQALKSQVGSAVGPYVSGGASGITVTINPTPQTGGILLVTMQLNGKQYVRGMVATAGFVNPALAQIVTPAA